MKIINCKKLARGIQDGVKDEIQKLGIRPGLAVLLAGDNEASQIYIKLKERACLEAGIYFEKWLYKEGDAKQEEIIQKIEELNKRQEINGIIVQLPLPKSFDTQKIIETILPEKDVDGFHPKNIENYFKTGKNLISPLIKGILYIIENEKFNLNGKRTCILAKDGLFTKLLQRVFENFGANVFVGDDKNILNKLGEFDLVIAAIGKEKFLRSSMVKDGCFVIDVGINKNKEGQVVGDVDKEGLINKSGWLTPVPGGVGPITVAMLLKNVLEFYKKQKLS